MPSTTDTTNWTGLRLPGGRYEVRAKLGEGGMGFVYHAHDRNLDTAVVIKVPRRAMLEDPSFAQRFSREIRALVQLQHPHVVKVLDVGEYDGVPFCVLQYLAGGSLDGRRRVGAGQVAIQPPSQLKDWLLGVAEALDFIHQRGFVHRDVKPANILFDEAGNVYLSDFGIAKAVADAPAGGAQASLTGEGMIVGTAQYMAPEILLGQKYDGRVDQYALAVTVYNLLTGQLPFEGPTPAAIVIKQNAQPPKALHELQPGISQALSRAVGQALSRDPAKRFPTCIAFAQAVLAAVDSSSGRGPSGGRAAVASDPSSFRVTCPSCGKTPRVPMAAQGKKVRCPHCKQSFQAIKPAARAVPVAPRLGETLVQAETEARVRRSEPAMEVLPVDADITLAESVDDVLPVRTVRLMLLGPALGLLVGAMIGLVVWPFLLYMWFADPPGGDVELFILAAIGVGLVSSLTVALGAVQMLRVHWYGLAVIACIIGIPAGSLIFTPFAVWGLAVLLQRHVRYAFPD